MEASSGRIYISMGKPTQILSSEPSVHIATHPKKYSKAFEN